MGTSADTATPVRFDDVGCLSPAFFQTWDAVGERAWARFAWELLEKRGLTDVGRVDRNVAVVRFVALSALTKEFYARKFGAGHSGDWAHEVGEAVVRPHGISSAWLLEMWRRSYEVEDDEEEELLFDMAVAELLPELVRGEAATVVQALRAELGDATLFVSLAASSTDVTYPLDGELDDWVDDAFGSDGESYAWIDSGMPI